jgi:hypothetical protein
VNRWKRHSVVSLWRFFLRVQTPGFEFGIPARKTFYESIGDVEMGADMGMHAGYFCRCVAYVKIIS